MEIEDLEKEKMEIIQKKKNTQKKIPFGDLDDNLKFDTSVNERKFFLDTLKVMVIEPVEILLIGLKRQCVTS